MVVAARHHHAAVKGHPRICSTPRRVAPLRCRHGSGELPVARRFGRIQADNTAGQRRSSRVRHKRLTLSSRPSRRGLGRLGVVSASLSIMNEGRVGGPRDSGGGVLCHKGEARTARAAGQTPGANSAALMSWKLPSGVLGFWPASLVRFALLGPSCPPFLPDSLSA